MRRIRSRTIPIAAAAMLSLSSIPVWAVDFNQTNLVTDDQSANPAQITDPTLKNAWGMSFGPTTPFWVSANGGGVSNLYSVNPSTQATTKAGFNVSIPPAGAGNPTGQVFNGNASSFNGNRFLFVSEDGTISGWRPALGTSGTVPADTIAGPSSANVYKGAAIGNVTGNDYLYAANFKTGTVDVYKGTSGAPDLTGKFTDPNLPSGYAPFNVQNLKDQLYVAYAERDNATNDEIKGAGKGFVDKFDLNGNFIERVASNGDLNAPWGLAIAPASFGPQAGDLLVGNFGDGHINVYDPGTHAFLGQLHGANNQPLAIDGLWAIGHGNGAAGGSTDLLYFTAGPRDEAHGLFGVLTPVPEPSEYAMMLAGLGVILLLGRRRANSFSGRPGRVQA
jgi:uncharacterized protein (TIGR03118 family)